MGQPQNRTMRCEEVTRAIAAPVAGDDSASLADHLSSCATCATFARTSAALDQYWLTTRPVEPSDASWNSVWSAISAGLDRAAQPAVMPISSAKHWWTRRSAALALTWAAALLLAGTLLWNRPGHSPVEDLKTGIGPVAQAGVAAFEIPEGQTGCIRFDGDTFTFHTIKVAQGGSRDAVDPGYDILGALEGMD